MQNRYLWWMFEPLKIMMVCLYWFIIRNRKFVFKIVFEYSMINLNKASHHESAKHAMNHSLQDTNAFLDFNSERHDSNVLFDNNWKPWYWANLFPTMRQFSWNECNTFVLICHSKAIFLQFEMSFPFLGLLFLFLVRKRKE